MLNVAGLFSRTGGTLETVVRSTIDGALEGFVKFPLIVASRYGLANRLTEIGDLGPAGHILARDLYPTVEAQGKALIELFEQYEINIFHQMGWMCETWAEVLEKYKGINQHAVDPRFFGGQHMYGRAAIAAHIYAARFIGNLVPVQPVAQWVAPEIDAGEIIHSLPLEMVWQDMMGLPLRSAVKRLQIRMLKEDIEATVQIQALKLIAEGGKIPKPTMSGLIRPFVNAGIIEEAKMVGALFFPKG